MADRLLDLADAARLSGLRVVELDGWRNNVSNGAFDPDGVLCHHTGAHDGPDDPLNDEQYARWMAYTGRPPTVPPPLCNLALSAEGVVYVCSAGNANHAGRARASGPMPAASDGSALYVGIEAMNSGSQGWATVGRDAAGNPVTQAEAYARLCAALCQFYGWPASHVRAHKETSVTGKWDPGLLNMDEHRATVARLLENGLEDDVAAEDVWTHQVDELDGKTKARKRSAERMLAEAHKRAGDAERHARRTERAVEALAKALGPQIHAAVEAALAEAVVDVNVTVGGGESK